MDSVLSDRNVLASPHQRSKLRTRQSSPDYAAQLLEVTAVLRGLQQLIEDYGPAWYPEAMESRVRRTLTSAEKCLRNHLH